MIFPSRKVWQTTRIFFIGKGNVWKDGHHGSISFVFGSDSLLRFFCPASGLNAWNPPGIRMFASSNSEVYTLISKKYITFAINMNSKLASVFLSSLLV